MGTKFTIITDNAALQYLEGHCNGSHQVARWSMLLSNYDYKVKYRPGVTNTNADGLSHVNHGTAGEDTTLSVFVTCATPASPDLPVCLDCESPPPLVYTAETAHVPALGPR